MKRTLLISLIISFSAYVNNLNAQNLGLGNAGLVTIQDLIDPTYSNTYEGNSDIQGDPFLYNEWSFGNIVLSTGDTLTKNILKYEIYNDFLLMKQESGEVINTRAGIIDYFTIERALFKNIDNKGYMEVLIEGPLTSLYKKHEKYVKEGQEATGYNYANTDSKFVKRETYYFIDTDGFIAKLPASKKLLKEKLSEMGFDAKQNKKLNTKNEEDLIEIFRLLNTSN